MILMRNNSNQVHTDRLEPTRPILSSRAHIHHKATIKATAHHQLNMIPMRNTSQAHMVRLRKAGTNSQAHTMTEGTLHIHHNNKARMALQQINTAHQAQEHTDSSNKHHQL